MSQANELNQANEFLEAEALAAERKVKVTAIVGVVMAIIVTGYMMWIGKAVEESVQPDLIVATATGAAINVIPEIGQDVKDGLIAAAPDVAKTLMDALVDGIPVMRRRLEDSIVVMTDEMSVASAEDVGLRLGAVLAKGVAADADAALEAAMATLVAQLDKEIYGPPSGRAKLRPDDKAGIFTSMRESADQLRRINGRLRGLANKANPTADDHAMKRLISTWMGVVSPADEN